jgi:hypothetical protein
MNSRGLSKYKSEDGESLLLPKEIVGAVELPASAVKKMVNASKERAPPTPAQVEARKRFAEAAKDRSRIVKEKKEAQAKEFLKKEAENKQEIDDFHADVKQRKIVKENEKVSSGTHVRVVIKPPPARRRKQETTTETDTTDVTETETEDDSDYKPKQRAIRRQAKKLVKTVEKIDKVIQQAPPSNPYASMLSSRWR